MAKMDERISKLLLLATRIGSTGISIAQMREDILSQIANWVDAQFGFWAWGRGMPLDSSIAPVAAIPVGLTAQKWAGMQETALSEDTVRLMNAPVRELLRSSPHVTASRSTFWSDQQWSSDPFVERVLHPMGIDNWLVSVHYFASDTWTSLTFFRALGKSDFSVDDLRLAELAIGSIAWMQPQVSESIPPATFVDLSPRLRSVMMLLLDGQSRKQIAAGMGLTLHIVNDHCKEIYTRFQVNSATELAALFLKST